MNKPLVSAIVPAHNAAAYLAEAIQSILNQTYPHVEIWVIDNGSRDATRDIALSFPQVQYVYSDIANAPLARNEGILRARGSLLAFLDQDDIWRPDKLEKQVAFLEKNSNFGAVICLQEMFLEPGCTKPHWLKREFLETPQSAYLPSALLVRKVVFEQTGLFDRAFAIASDTDWFFKAKHSGVEVAVLEEVLLHRRIHGDNASNHCSQLHKELFSMIHLSLQQRRQKVSVIISVHNGENYLAEAIESALNQTHANKEIIIVNDGSTDSTQAIIDRFSSRIRSLYQERKGLGAARNAATQVATGHYLAFLDHDDLWESNKLSLQMEKMDASDPLVFCYVKQFVCPTLSLEERKNLIVDENALPAYFAGTLLVSKARFQQIGPFFEKNEVGEFVDWYLRALEAKVPMLMLEQVGLYRRIHKHNMGRQKELYSRVEYLKILKNSLDRRRVYAATS